MLQRVFFLLFGGILGTGLRYLISGWAMSFSKSCCLENFPLGTLLVNSIGALIAGFLWGMLGHSQALQNYKLFYFVGFLGAFTTFSAYSVETLVLFLDGKIKLGLINILLNNTCSLLLVFLGFWMAKALILKID